MMASSARSSLDPVADLKRRLARRSNRQLRGCVRAWWNDHALGEHPASVGKRIALALLEQRATEPKLAGILVLQELLADHLRASDLPSFARLFAAGHLTDWNVVDWFGVRVLGTLLQRVRGRGEVARGLAQLIFTLCATIVWSPERYDQTAVGWVLGELSRAEPTRVETFFRRNARLMSRECARHAVEQLPNRSELLAWWKRATSLRRS